MRELLPDATFAGWDEIGAALERALASPPSDPVVPDSNLAAYASTPLAQKLGIKEGSVVCLVDAPEGFYSAGLACRRRRAAARVARPDHGLGAERDRGEARLGPASAPTRRSTTSGSYGRRRLPRSTADVKQANVREPGMARGFVDFKVCAIDETWTALRFKRRR